MNNIMTEPFNNIKFEQIKQYISQHKTNRMYPTPSMQHNAYGGIDAIIPDPISPRFADCVIVAAQFCHPRLIFYLRIKLDNGTLIHFTPHFYYTFGLNDHLSFTKAKTVGELNNDLQLKIWEYFIAYCETKK